MFVNRMLAAGCRVLAAAAFAVPALPPAVAELTLEIEPASPRVFQGEPILVHARLRNAGQDAVSEVRAPSSIAFVLTYSIERVEADGARAPVEGMLHGIGAPAWTASSSALAPRAALASTGDVLRQYPGLERPGTYAIRGVYHFGVYESEQWNNETLTSNEVTVTIEPRTRELERQWNRLKNIEMLRDGAKKRRSIHEFLSNNPDSVYELRALDILLTTQFHQEDWEGVGKTSRRIRQAGASEEYQDLLFVQQALALKQRGKLDAAIKLLADVDLPNARIHRQELIAQRDKAVAAAREAAPPSGP